MIAYIRIPKTASCTVLAALENTGVKSVDHEPLSFYGDVDASFTIIRNPWTRLFSWYRHAKYFQRRTFEEYVMGDELDPMNPVAPTQFYRHGNANQTDMLVADQSAWWRGGRPTYIGKIENLGSDIACIGKLMGFQPGEVRHLNKSNDRHDQPYDPKIWTPEMVERMAPIFTPFADEFGYLPPTK